MDKEDLIEILNYLATTKEVQMFNKYQRLLKDLVAKENPPVRVENGPESKKP